LKDVDHCAVAVVDDDPDVRDSLRFLLDVMGHPVETFASAAEFLNTAMQGLACLIVDNQMPNMTGLELVETLRAHGMGIPVLLMTGSLSPAVVARAAELGIDRVIEKPPCDEALMVFINALGRPGGRGRH
jgi:FixJ family two-component response regulator